MLEISGIHHVALGVRDIGPVISFYRDILGFKCSPQPAELEPHEVMSELTRGVVPVFGADMLSHEAGDILVEYVKMVVPSPRPIRSDFAYGDIGVNKVTIAVADMKNAYSRLRDRVNFCSAPGSVEIPGFGNYSFAYCRDPEGNLVEFSSAPAFSTGFGGAVCVGIGVTDLDRSLAFYQKYTGFDSVFVPVHESFSGALNEITAGVSARIRSCVLSSSRGGGKLELFEKVQPRGRSIPAYTLWGDYGYHQVCMLCKNAAEASSQFEKAGLDFVIKLQSMPGGKIAFTYIRDPDGNTLEFLSFAG